MSRYDFDVEDMPVGFAFPLNGKVESTLERGRGEKAVSIMNQRGVNTIMCLHGAKGHSQYLSHEILNALIICVEPRIFAHNIG